MKRISVAAAVILVALAGTVSGQEVKEPREAPRVGAVNFGRVFTNYAKATDLKNEMEVLLEPFKKDAKAIKDAMVHLKVVAETPNLDPAIVQGARDEFQKKKQILEDMEKQARKLIGSKQEEQMVALFREVSDTTHKLAEERKLELVLGYGDPDNDPWTFVNVNRAMQALDMGAVRILYARPGVDLTDTVIQRLNAQYREKRDGEKDREIKGVGAK